MKKFLRITLAALAIMCSFAFLTAFADSFSSAEYASLNTWEYGEFTSSNKEDYYYFYMDSTGKLDIDFETNNKYVYYYLYDSYGNTVYSNYIINNFSLKNNHLYLYSGQYYIKFYYKNYYGDYCFKLVSTATNTDTTKPTVSISASPYQSAYTNETVTFTANISDNKSLSNVYLNLNNVWKTGKYVNGVTSTSISYSVSTANLAVGTHTIEVVAQDVAGNTTKTTYTFTKASAPRAPVPGGTNPYPYHHTPYPTINVARYQIEFLNLANIYRSWYSAAPLTLDRSLLSASETFIREIAINGEQTWTRTDGSHWSTILDNVNHTYRTAGQWVSSSATSAEAFFYALTDDMLSNIRSTEYTKLGISRGYTQNGTPCWFYVLTD